MKKFVLSQPMLFPWVGTFEQIRLADHFIHYNDAPFSQGDFFNRMQIKTDEGLKWMTVPLKNLAFGNRIDEVKIDTEQNWEQEHRSFLEAAYAQAPFVNEMLNLVDEVYSQETESLSELTQKSIEVVAGYFELDQQCQFTTASSLEIQGMSSERILRIGQSIDGRIYITGHGAKKYLDHNLLERNGISTQYIDYRRKPYSQLHGGFNPHVSVLDLIANHGRSGIDMICSPSILWKVFLERPSQKRVA